MIGAGVVGCAVARRLSADWSDVFVVERHAYPAEEQSGRNSGVVHAGIYYQPGSLKSRLCATGNRMLYDFCAEHDVPCRRVGKLVVAVSDEEVRTLRLLEEWARKNHARGVHMIGPGEVRAHEPGVRALCALHCPSTGVVEPAHLVRSLVRLAGAQGADFLFGAEVTALEPCGDGVRVEVAYSGGGGESVVCEHLVNAAGLASDRIARMLDPDCRYSLSPVRGEYCWFNRRRRRELEFRGTNVYPAPPVLEIGGGTRFTVGVHLTPTFEVDKSGDVSIGRKVLVGPTADVVERRDDYAPPRLPPEEFVRRVERFFPSLRPEDLEPDYAGIQAKLTRGDDFVIERDRRCPACVHAIGIDSPGLTSSLAIAEEVARLLQGGVAR